MTETRATLYFDFVDPLSYLIDLALAALPEAAAVTREGLEMRPPPAELLTADDPVWAARWTRARQESGALGAALATPGVVPWSRKAIELHRHADAAGAEVGASVRRAIFEAFFGDGLDIGRVDVLVEIARKAGLDTTETKAVLDVDRWEPTVTEARAAAATRGITVVPTLVVGSARLEGFHNATALGTFLRDAPE